MIRECVQFAREELEKFESVRRITYRNGIVIVNLNNKGDVKKIPTSIYYDGSRYVVVARRRSNIRVD